MKKYLFAVVALTVACSNPNSPSPIPSVENVQASSNEQAPVSVALPEPDGPIAVKVTFDGAIANSTGDRLIGCLYDATVFTRQILLEEFIAKPGRTEASYVNDSCSPIKLQTDVLPWGESCPLILGSHKGFITGKVWEMPAGRTDCDDCVPGEWEEISNDRVDGQWGQCPATSTVREICYECMEFATTIVESNGCEKRTKVSDGLDKREIKCDECVIEPVEKTRDVVYGEWSECSESGHINASCGSKCHQSRTKTVTITETFTCEKEPVVTVKKSQEQRECKCPEPAACFYTVDCRSHGPSASTTCPEIAKGILCKIAGGDYRNWNGQANQCKTDLPGILKSNFRLVPGQSDRACLKYTGQ